LLFSRSNYLININNNNKLKISIKLCAYFVKIKTDHGI
jgi:hypothetical protein